MAELVKSPGQIAYEGEQRYYGLDVYCDWIDISPDERRRHESIAAAVRAEFGDEIKASLRTLIESRRESMMRNYDRMATAGSDSADLHLAISEIDRLLTEPKP